MKMKRSKMMMILKMGQQENRIFSKIPKSKMIRMQKKMVAHNNKMRKMMLKQIKMQSMMLS